MPGTILRKVDYIKADGAFAPASERIVKETALTINVNGRLYATAMVMGALEKEYVYGHLYTQGVIRRAADIASLTMKNHTIDVALVPNVAKATKPREVRSVLQVHRQDIFACVRTILKSEIFTETEAVHSAGLFLDGKDPVCLAEDLGRHHALDKVIGSGLMQGIDFSQTVAASTGRQPSEMLDKCRTAGIPIIATKGVPTALAIEIAVKAGITIAGLVRGDTMIVYSHPERIL
jgi:FdhD protein